MTKVLQDIRFGARVFVRNPGFSLAALLAIALGIGANTAVFSVVHAVLLQPLPFPEPERLVYIHDTYPAVQDASVSAPKYFMLRDGSRTLTALGAMTPASVTLTGGGEPEQVPGYRASASLFTVLGIRPLHGRFFAEEEDTPNGPKAVLISEGLWKRRFGGDPAVVGTPVIVNGQSRTLVGVVPDAAVYPALTQAWVPLERERGGGFGGGNFLRLVGRMRPDVTLAQVGEDLGALTAAFNAQNGFRRDTAVVSLQERGRAPRRRQLLVLQGAVAFVLLIACANVANLLLARSVTREREFAVRTALGAGRRRLVGQVLTESVVLAVIGGALGILVAAWLLRLFTSLAPTYVAGGVRMNGWVLAFTFGLAALTGLVCGVAPTVRGAGADPAEALREGGRTGMTPAARASSRALVVLEVALALVLATGAGLMVKSLMRLQDEDPGFDPRGLLTLEVSLPPSTYPPPKAIDFVRRTLGEISTLPGVRAAGGINMLPLVNFGFNGPFRIDGRPPFTDAARAPVVEYRAVTPQYFEAAGIPLRAGRRFDERDNSAGAPVVIVNQALADRFWPGASPIGARLWLASDGPDNGKTPLREIVGVVGDVRSQRLDAPPAAETYMPYDQMPLGSLAIVVRSAAGDPDALAPGVRERVRALDPNLPLIRVRGMEAVVDGSTGAARLLSTLTAVFAALAALLATLGVYSVIAYSVAQRVRELGVRVALGADRLALAKLVLGEALVLAGTGIAFGIAGTLLLRQTLKSLLYEVSATDPAVLAATCGVVLGIAGLASYVPARRAMRIDPMVALRAE